MSSGSGFCRRERNHAIDFWVRLGYAKSIMEQDLPTGHTYFDTGGISIFKAHFITVEGREKLRKDWPTIWKEFGFDKE